MTPLQAIFHRFRCDKGERHGYHRLYESLPAPARMLEVGVYRGASIQSWLAWFPNAEVWTIDLFDRNPPPPCLTHPRVVWMKGDSRRARFEEDSFDLIIDDGSHRYRDQSMTLENLWPSLRPGGRYFIEDVWPWDVMSDEERTHWWLKERPDDFNGDAWEDLWATVNGVSGEVVRHDLRVGAKPDSYVIEIRKPNGQDDRCGTWKLSNSGSA